MNTISRILVATLFMMSLLSCNDQLSEYVTDAAYITADINGSATKTNISQQDNVYKVIWTKDDELAVFSKDEGPFLFSIVSGEGTSSGIFKGYLDDCDKCTAIYPYEMVTGKSGDRVEIYLSDTQVNVEGGIADSSMPMYSTAKLGSLNFRILGSVLNLRLKGATVLKSVTLKSNGGELLSGNAVLDIKDQEYPELTFKGDAKDYIKLDCDGVILDNNISDLYIVIPPVCFEEGFTLEVETYTGTFIKKVNKQVSFSRAEMRSLEPFVVEGDMPDPDKRSDRQLWYKTSDGKICEVENEFAFDSKIISHTYGNGFGIISFDAPPTKVADVVFKTPESIVELYLPNTIKTIGNYAFTGICVSEIHFPSSLKELGLDAFSSNNNVRTITIPEGVTLLGAECFASCTALEYVNLPSTLEEVEVYVFNKCDNLRGFTGDTQFISEDGKCFFENSGYGVVSKNLNTLAKVAGRDLESYRLPENVKFIQNYAFSACKNLKSLYLPDDLGNLSRTALEGCDALEELHGKYIMDDGRSFVSNSILHFVLTKGLTVYNSPEGIEWLSSDLFNGDQNLKELNIGEGVKGVMTGFLESYLFASMNLEVLNLPSTISNLGIEPFLHSKSLKSLYIKSVNPPAVQFDEVYYDHDYPSLTIYVPRESLQTYLNSPDWSCMKKYFKGYDFEN